MARKLQAIIIASLLAFTSAKVVPVISEQYETCVSPENSAGKYDTSGVELIALTDTDLFVNGSLKILKEVKSPFSGKVFAERFDRGAWSLELFNRNYNDFCTTFINPLEPSYVFTSKMEPKACPFPANSEIKFNMIQVRDDKVNFPRSFMGKWRITFNGTYGDSEGKMECYRFYFDLLDDA